MFSENKLKVALMSMPFAPPEAPPLSVGIFKSILRNLNIDCQSFYLSNEFKKLCSYINYESISVDGTVNELTAWMFSKQTFGHDPPGYLDAFFETAQHEDLKNLRGKFEQKMQQLAKYDWSSFDIFGFTCTFGQKVSSLCMAKMIKDQYPKKIMILGGSEIEPKIGRELLFHCPWIDYIFVGEADITFPEVIKRISNNEDIQGMKSVMYRLGDGIHFCGTRQTSEEEMENLPTPDFDEFYENNDDQIFIPVEYGRGCKYAQDSATCSFCGIVSDKKYRHKSEKRLHEDLFLLKKKYNPDYFIFVDILIPCQVLENLPDNLAKFIIEIRVDSIPYDQMNKLGNLSKKGLSALTVGIESFSSETLKLMKKGIRAIDSISFLKWCKHSDIWVNWFLLVGTVNEDPNSWQHTESIIKKIMHLPCPRLIPVVHHRNSPYALSLKLDYAKCYPFIYPPEFNYSQIADVYRLVHPGQLKDRLVSMQAAEKIVETVAKWRRSSYVASLTQVGDTVYDNRDLADRKIWILNSEHRKLLEYCHVPRHERNMESFNKADIDYLVLKNLLLHLDRRFLNLIEPDQD